MHHAITLAMTVVFITTATVWTYATVVTAASAMMDFESINESEEPE